MVNISLDFLAEGDLRLKEKKQQDPKCVMEEVQRMRHALKDSILLG